MSIADELFEEVKAEQEKHYAVLMSLDTAELICDAEEQRNSFREVVLKFLKVRGKYED